MLKTNTVLELFSLSIRSRACWEVHQNSCSDCSCACPRGCTPISPTQVLLYDSCSDGLLISPLTCGSTCLESHPMCFRPDCTTRPTGGSKQPRLVVRANTSGGTASDVNCFHMLCCCVPGLCMQARGGAMRMIARYRLAGRLRTRTSPKRAGGTRVNK